ncbi:cation transporter [Modicisalibacter zincidurans]|nr:cation transporter [Halomonas sp. IOP_31]
MDGSLALLADAAHTLTDAGGLALALIAIRFAKRETTTMIGAAAGRA